VNDFNVPNIYYDVGADPRTARCAELISDRPVRGTGPSALESAH